MNQGLFLQELFKDNGGYVDIREFNRKGKVTGRHFMTLPQAQAQQWPGDKNIWFGVYARGDKRNGKAAGYQHSGFMARLDNMNLQEVRARLGLQGCHRSIYVNSGGGCSCLLAVNQAAKRECNPYLKSNGGSYRGRYSRQKSQVMRLPETFNVKYNPARPCHR